MDKSNEHEKILKKLQAKVNRLVIYDDFESVFVVFFVVVFYNLIYLRRYWMVCILIHKST